MSTVVVTGATGLIGSRLVRSLAGRHEVHAVSRSLGEPVPGVERRLANFAEAWHTTVLPKKADVLVHLAQSDSWKDFPGSAKLMFDVNVASTERLLEWANGAGVRTVVVASSGGVYGRGSKPFEETDRRAEEAADFYLRTRIASELVALGWAERMRVIVLRFFFVYGKGQDGAFLLPRLIESVRNGAVIDLQGEHGIRLNPIHVDDAARAVEAALGAEESGIVNVAGPDVLSMREIARAIGDAVGRAPELRVDANAAPLHLIGDIRKMSRLLGAPRVRFPEGIRASV